MAYKILVIASMIIFWIGSSTFVWYGLKALKGGTLYDQIHYQCMNPVTRFALVLFGPLVILKKLLDFLLDMWAYILIIAVIVWIGTLLSGCQVNVITAPNATFMVDSVTAESINQDAE